MENWIIGQHSQEEVLGWLRANASTVTGKPVFCFDYFDTLVGRNVFPEKTKLLAAGLLREFTGCALLPRQIYESRSELERELCSHNAARGGELEFYLPQLGPPLLKHLQEHDPKSFLTFTADTFTALLLEVELTVELQVQSPCEEVIEVVQALKKSGHTTILISDFYLPVSHFSQFLHHFSLTSLFDRIYISADHGLAKKSGRLYDAVMGELRCLPGHMVMIGDNAHADIAVAAEKGMATLHVQNPKQQELYARLQTENPSPARKVTTGFNTILGSLSFPFREMAASLWLFTARLYGLLLCAGVKDVFFFSKEGEFLKSLFDHFQNKVGRRSLIRSHYLLISRKATFLASLKPLEQEDFSRLFNQYRDISLRDFLLSLNFEESVSRELCAELGIMYEERIPDLKNHFSFSSLIQSPQFFDLYEKQRKQQHSNFITYLQSFGVEYLSQGLTIVDVGWKGSIQDNLYHIFEGKVAIKGYFIGSLTATENKDNNRKQGLLFNDYPEPSSFFTVYNNNRSLFEMVLGATHGSADGYFTEEEYEQLPADQQRCVHTQVCFNRKKVLAAALDLPEERELFNTVIRPVQAAVHKACAAFTGEFIQNDYTMPAHQWFAKKHARMVFYPKKKEIDFFERLYHLENFGVFEYTNFLAGHTLPAWQRLKNLREVMQNNHVLESGIWPPIILRRLGIGKYRHVDGLYRYYKAFFTRGLRK